MKYTMVLLGLLVHGLCSAQDPWKDIYRESAWEQRDKWQRADEIVAKLTLKQGGRVADIGAHEGYFTMKLSKTVGAEGRVYAVDVSRDKTEKLKDHLAERKIENVSVILGDENNPHLPALALDAVLIVDAYHEMDAHQEMLRAIKNALKSRGKLVICEPISDERKKLSREDQERKHELGINYALEDLRQMGFKIISQQESFVDRLKEKGDKMWIIVCEKSN